MSAQPSGDATFSITSTSVLAWLRCPYCLDQLEGPTTLRCGHTVCSAHVQLNPPTTRLESPSESLFDGCTSGPTSPTSELNEGSSSAREASATLNGSSSRHTDLPSCPLRECHANSFTRVAVEAPIIPSSSRVSYYPPPLSANSSTSSLPSNSQHPDTKSRNPPSQKRVANPRQDITVGKILDLTITASLRYERLLHRPAQPVALSKMAPDSDTDSDGEREAEEVTQPVVSDVRQQLPDRLKLHPEIHPSRQRRQRSSTSSGSSPTTPSQSHRSKRPRTLEKPEEPDAYDHPIQPCSQHESADGEVSYFKELFQELQCEICFSMLYEPLTTPCQHVSLC